MPVGWGDRRREGPSGHTLPKPAPLPLGCLSSGAGQESQMPSQEEGRKSLWGKEKTCMVI